MEDLLLKAATHAGTLAIRTSISLATGYAMRGVTKYINDIPQKNRGELERLKILLESKIKVVQPSIDLIEIIAARGNTSLEAVLVLTNSLRLEIDSFARNIAGDGDSKMTQDQVIRSMKDLLTRIEDAVPLLNLSLTVSGANLGSNMSSWVSPSRLLLASSYILTSDQNWNKKDRLQVGPSVPMKLYYLFGASVRNDDRNDFTWKEEYAKCRVTIYRVESSNEDIPFAYELELWEDLNDGRYHEEVSSIEETEKGKFIPGKSKKNYPLHQLTRLFFSVSGQLLSIEDSHSPVLVLKIIKSMALPVKTIRLTEPITPIPQDNNTIEWLALEHYIENNIESESQDESESESENESEIQDKNESSSDDEKSSNDEVETQLTNLNLSTTSLSYSTLSLSPDHSYLSILEYLIRLCACQITEQTSHIYIKDERLNIFLRDDQNMSAAEVRSSHRQPGSSKKSSRRGTPRSTPTLDTPTPVQRTLSDKSISKPSRLVFQRDE